MAKERRKAVNHEANRRLNMLVECSNHCHKCETHVRMIVGNTLFGAASRTLESLLNIEECSLDNDEPEWELEDSLDRALQDCCIAYAKLVEFGVDIFRASADAYIEDSARDLRIEAKSTHELAIFYLVGVLARASTVASCGAFDDSFAPEAILKSRDLSFPLPPNSADVKKRVCMEILSFCGRPNLHFGCGLTTEFEAIRKLLVGSELRGRMRTAAGSESDNVISAVDRTSRMSKKEFAAKLKVSVKTLTKGMKEGIYKFIPIGRQAFIFDKQNLPNDKRT